MQITELVIRNLKSFRDETKINFSDKINILIGANNSGKSTILQSILLLQSYSVLKRSNISFRKSFCEIEISFKNPEKFIRGDIPDLWRDYKQTVIFSTKNSNGIIPHKIYQTNNAPFKPISQNEPNNLIYPFLSKRKVNVYSEDVKLESLNTVSGNFTFINAKVDRLTNPDHKYHRVYRQACEEIIGLPITSISSPNGKKAVCFLTDTEHIPLEDMGEGVPNLLALIVDLCIAENKVFIIEEPENDVHPKALKALLLLIESKSINNQFFISTHSNIVTKYLGAIFESKTFQITQTYGEHRIPKSEIQEIANDEHDRIKVLEDLGYDFYDFGLWKGWLFLEEASAETIINRVIIPYFLPNLSGKLRTFSSNGFDSVKVKFDNFNIIETFVYANLEPVYKNRAWVILDSGIKEGETLAQLRKVYTPKGWNEGNFMQFTEHDFEKYYPERFQEEITAILAIEDRKERNRKKIELLKDKVLKWIEETDSENIKTEFGLSAREVIEKIKLIEEEL